MQTPLEDAGQSTASAPSSQKKNLLAGIQMEITLRFGQRRIPLREILELGPAAIIELDRQIDEPVDLLVGGKPIARGEVVVADGNYALRVTEIVNFS